MRLWHVQGIVWHICAYFNRILIMKIVIFILVYVCQQAAAALCMCVCEFECMCPKQSST
jgi:hypothetical protein